MTDRLADCLPIVLISEGGFSDRPSDPGGATMDGITLNTFMAYLGRSATVNELRSITLAQVYNIYQREIWTPSHAGDCPPGLDLMVFDAATNSGPGRAVRWLQQSVGVTADGLVGPATLAAIAACRPATAITLFQNLRLTFLHALSDAADNPGWFTRVVRTVSIAQKMAEAAAQPATS